MQINILKIYQAHKKKIGILGLILFLCLVYFLSLNTRQRIRKDAAYWQKQSLLVNSLLSRGNSEQEIISILEKKFGQRNRIMPQQQGQNMLQLVRDYAQRMNIRVTDLKSYQTSIVINSCAVQVLVVQMQAEAGYLNLVEYLNVLGQVSGEAVSVERLKAKKDEINTDKLKVELELRFYGPSL